MKKLKTKCHLYQLYLRLRDHWLIMPLRPVFQKYSTHGYKWTVKSQYLNAEHYTRPGISSLCTKARRYSSPGSWSKLAETLDQSADSTGMRLLSASQTSSEGLSTTAADSRAGRDAEPRLAIRPYKRTPWMQLCRIARKRTKIYELVEATTLCT